MLTLGPRGHFVQRTSKRNTKRGEAVLHLSVRRADDAPRQQAIALELAEVLGEHLVRDVGHRPPVPRFTHVIDLTHALDEGTPYIPVPNTMFPFKTIPIATVAKNGVAAYRWEIHEHPGTQIDAPNHFFDRGLSLDQLPADRLVDRGRDEAYSPNRIFTT